MLKDFLKDKATKRLAFFLAGVAGAGIIILLLMHLGDIFSGAEKFIGWVLGVTTGFIAGLVIAYLLVGVVEILQKQLQRIPFFDKRPMAARGLCIAATYLLIFIVVIGVLLAILIAITKRVQTINFADLPKLIQQLQIEVVGLMNSVLDTLEKFGIATDGMKAWINELTRSITGSLSNVGSGVLGFAGSVTGFFTDLLFAVIFSIYFLYDTKGLMTYWSKAFKAMLGEKAHGVFAILLKDLDTCFAGYIRGQLADAAFMAVAVSILLGLVGVPYAVVIGVLSGVGNLIPYVGPIVAYGLTIGVCVATGQWQMLAIAIILIFILQTVDGNVINPRLLSASIDVHPVLVILGLLFGSAIGGLAGMLLAVPVASFLKIQFERFVKWRSEAGGV